MPAALPVDRVQVQMLALEVGVREAARMLNLPESTVQSWSQREGWLAPAPKKTLPPTVIQAATSATVSPRDALKQALEERGNKSRLALAKGFGAAADRIGEMSGDQVIAISKEAKDITGSLATVHGWDAGSAGARVDLHLTCGESAPIIEVSATDCDALP